MYNNKTPDSVNLTSTLLNTLIQHKQSFIHVVFEAGKLDGTIDCYASYDAFMSRNTAVQNPEQLKVRRNAILDLVELSRYGIAGLFESK